MAKLLHISVYMYHTPIVDMESKGQKMKIINKTSGGKLLSTNRLNKQKRYIYTSFIPFFDFSIHQLPPKASISLFFHVRRFIQCRVREGRSLNVFDG